MGNECNQCQPVMPCGRQALRKSIGQNPRAKLDLTSLERSIQKNQSIKEDKQNANTIEKQKDLKIQSTQQKSNDESKVHRSIQFIQLSYGITLQGQFKGNVRDGKSKLTWPDGSQLVVYYLKNKPVGKLKFNCQNQGYYQGQSDGFVAVGSGKMQLMDGSIYQGQWKDDKPHGNGLNKFPDGSIYEGQFVNGSKSGKGKYTFSNKSIYVGSFLDGYFHGNGILKYTDGRQYSGEWKNGMCHGKGTMVYDESIRYEGNFVEGQRQGFGIYYFGDGRSWQGRWVGNLQDGQGKYINKDGSIQHGVWKMGQNISKTTSQRQKLTQKRRSLIKIQDQ